MSDLKTPTTPSNLSDYAVACMQSLTEHGLARFLSIGGAVGLSYYHQYRTTNDIDAWWESDTGEQDHQKLGGE